MRLEHEYIEKQNKKNTYKLITDKKKKETSLSASKEIQSLT